MLAEEGRSVAAVAEARRAEAERARAALLANMQALWAEEQERHRALRERVEGVQMRRASAGAGPPAGGGREGGGLAAAAAAAVASFRPSPRGPSALRPSPRLPFFGASSGAGGPGLAGLASSAGFAGSVGLAGGAGLAGGVGIAGGAGGGTGRRGSATSSLLGRSQRPPPRGLAAAGLSSLLS
jgi:hypothetical protein